MTDTLRRLSYSSPTRLTVQCDRAVRSADPTVGRARSQRGILAYGFEHVRSEDYVWGTAAHHIYDEHNLIFD